MKLIVPITKWPHGRIGPKHLQDWYRSLVKCVKIARRSGDAKILVLSGVLLGGLDEHNAYVDALEELGCDNLLVIIKGQDTTEQIEYLERLQHGHPEIEIVLVTTWLHYLRVAWLKLDLKAEHHIAFGIPHRQYALYDILLGFIFPVIDYFGLGRRFSDAVRKRRLSGQLF